MKKAIITVLVLAAVATAALLSSPQSVMARPLGPPPPPKPFNPAAGSWSWDNEDVTGTLIPQYQLAPTQDDDYALLQSPGLYVSGGTQLCHPYPGGQLGWNAEIRVLTSTGWQSVPTVNQWVPDEEGKFMTCANVWSSGTYAVFGYWQKPDGWGVVVDHSCADLPALPLRLRFYPYSEWVYVRTAATFDWTMIDQEFAGTTRGRCSTIFPGAIETDHLIVGGGDQGYDIFMFQDMYCACDSMYKLFWGPEIGILELPDR